MHTSLIPLTLFLIVVAFVRAPTSTYAAIEVRVLTTPPLEGARFELSGKVFESDAQGQARMVITQPGTYELKALPFDYKDGVRAEFHRWCCPVDSRFPEIEVDISDSGGTFQAGYRLSYLVDANFQQLGGAPVDEDQIEKIRIRNDQGQRIELTQWSPQWLLGQETRRVRGGLAQKDIAYRLEEVIVRGSNVVNRGQQKLVPSFQDEWNIELLYYTLEASVADYLYGNAAGSTIVLLFPDGKQHEYKLDSKGRVSLPSLPRGAYEIGVKGHGITLMQPVSLSRNQEVDLQFVTYADIATGILLGLIACLSLIAIGRPHLVARIIRRIRP